MKKTIMLCAAVLAFITFPCTRFYTDAADVQTNKDIMEEEIWALEKVYFSSLYNANYDKMLALTHNHFLGWPGVVSKPVDKEGSARFMKQLITEPTSCVFTIERAGIRLLSETALTQYTIHVNCLDNSGAAKKQSSRITHTWIKEDNEWKLLGGMSHDN